MRKPTAKSAQTRQLLLDTAMKLFATKGFAGTTMRSIAQESGLSLGNAYYYFESKDSIVHELFRQLFERHLSSTLPLLVPGNNLETNLRIALGRGLEIMTPFQEFGPAFIRTAFAGSNPELGNAQRALELGLWRQVVTASRPLPPLAIRSDLPQLLWLIQRGIFLFWAYDSSPGAARSHRLIKNIAPMVARLVVLSRMPVVRSILDDIISLVRTAS
jgi:AcrR family transcriptional regulator